jgi:hypothetical protein
MAMCTGRAYDGIEDGSRWLVGGSSSALTFNIDTDVAVGMALRIKANCNDNAILWSPMLARRVVTPTGPNVGWRTVIRTSGDKFDIEWIQERDPASWYGPELLTNRDFSGGTTGWTFGTGWSASSGAVHAPGATAPLVQAGFTVDELTIYEVETTITGRSAGTCTLQIGGSSSIQTVGLANTTFTNNFTILEGNAGTSSITFTPTSDFNGKINSVSVKRKIPPDQESCIFPLQLDANRWYYVGFSRWPPTKEVECVVVDYLADPKAIAQDHWWTYTHTVQAKGMSSFMYMAGPDLNFSPAFPVIQRDRYFAHIDLALASARRSWIDEIDHLSWANHDSIGGSPNFFTEFRYYQVPQADNNPPCSTRHEMGPEHWRDTWWDGFPYLNGGAPLCSEDVPIDAYCDDGCGDCGGGGGSTPMWKSWR